MQISQLPTSTIFNSNDVIAIEINGATYKLSGASLATALKTLGNFAKTTGDTMTGTLTIVDDAWLNKKNASMDVQVNPSANKYTNGVVFRDKNDRITGQIDNTQYTNGQIATRILTFDYDTSGNQTAFGGIYIYGNRDGQTTYTVTNPAAFRSAIGANQALVTFTAGSNVAITRNNSFAVGKYIFVSAVIQTTAAISGASTTILSLPSGSTAIRMADLSALALNSTNQYSLVAAGGGSTIRSNLSGSLSMPAGYYHIVGNIELT